MITPLEAAKLVLSDYSNQSVNVLESVDIDGVQTCILDVSPNDRVGLIRGTNQFSDWLRYNLPAMPDSIPGDIYNWHRGFLAHARIAYAFLKNKNCTVIVGHSLGAAAGGIVAVSLKLPAILFATPMALFGSAIPPEASLIENYCREDDIVARLPFWFLNYQHVGNVNWLRPTGPHIGQDHGISHYIELFELLEQTEI